MVLGQGGSTLATPRLDDKAQCAWMKRCGSVCACVCVRACVCACVRMCVSSMERKMKEMKSIVVSSTGSSASGLSSHHVPNLG